MDQRVEPKWLLAIHVQVRLDQAAVAMLRRESAAASLSWVFLRESRQRCTLSSAAYRSQFSTATRDAILVVILADPAILAAVLKLVVAVRLLAAALKQPVAILADQQVVVHLAVALKQLVVQHRVTADVA